MSKKNEAAYNEAKHEEDTHRMTEYINQRNADHKTEETGRSIEKAHEREKMRRMTMCRHIARCAAIAAFVIGLFYAMDAGLIAPVLALPATYIGTGYFGWCLCKVAGVFHIGKGRSVNEHSRQLRYVGAARSSAGKSPC